MYNLAMREVAKSHISQVLSIERGGKKRQNQFEEMSEINRKKWLLVPVAVWVTMDYAPPAYSDSYTWILPDGEEYVPYTNLHCVVLTGEEYGQYRVADPINGWQTVEKETFWSRRSFPLFLWQGLPCTVQVRTYCTMLSGTRHRR